MPNISLTNPSNITELRFNSISTQKLGGAIQSLDAFTNLEEFFFIDHELTGSIPDISSNTVFRELHCQRNSLQVISQI